MKFVIAFVALFALSSALVMDGDVDAQARLQWDQFKYQYGKTYSPSEELERFEVFKTNLMLVEKYNSNEPQRPYGITKFMDMSEEEFAAAYLMKVDFNDADMSGNSVHVEPTPEALPSTFDWRNKAGVVTPVKNQGQCGSCWDFSATETMESVCALAGYGLNEFSEQQIVDCDHDGVYGCDGGYPNLAYKYIISVGGIESEADYPYEARDDTCRANSADFEACKITSWNWVGSQGNADESVMQTYAYNNSPLSICADASSWQFYNGGVVMGNNCGQQLDHCIQITGWTVKNSVKAWTVRNSWGTDWGDDGFIYLQYGTNTCGLATYVTVPCVTAQDGSTQC